MVSTGTVGRVERKMDDAGGNLREIRLAVNGITAHLLAENKAEGSVFTTYPDDDKGVWRELRRELNREGFSSNVIHQNKKIIKAYIQELGSRGVLDDSDTTNVHASRFATSLDEPQREAGSHESDTMKDIFPVFDLDTERDLCSTSPRYKRRSSMGADGSNDEKRFDHNHALSAFVQDEDPESNSVTNTEQPEKETMKAYKYESNQSQSNIEPDQCSSHSDSRNCPSDAGASPARPEPDYKTGDGNTFNFGDVVSGSKEGLFARIHAYGKPY